MIQIESNIGEVVERIKADLNGIDTDKMTRLVATSVMNEIKVRVHKEGKAADGSQIGTYSKEYMKVRTDSFKSPVIARGKNKGKPRLVYNRKNDKRVILSLTSRMEGDMIITPIENGTGICYTNEKSYKKSQWNEKRYKKSIFALSKREIEIAEETVKEFIDETL